MHNQFVHHSSVTPGTAIRVAKHKCSSSQPTREVGNYSSAADGFSGFDCARRRTKAKRSDKLTQCVFKHAMCAVGNPDRISGR